MNIKIETVIILYINIFIFILLLKMDIRLDILQELYDFWFSIDTSKYWFDSTSDFDDLIKTKYTHILTNLSIDKLSKQTKQKIEDDYRLSIGLILLHDQIPRHIYRKNQDNTEINNYLSLILDFSRKIYVKYKYDFRPNDYCFVLLPLRHTNDFNNIMYVIQETKIKIKNDENESIYKKFFKATLERYIKFNNDRENIVLFDDMIQDVIQINDKKQICELELLKYFPTKYSDIEWSIVPNFISNLFETVKKNSFVKKGIISLSGGVDSMILSYILKYIGIDLIAIHINYNNRPECENECDILKQWCSFLNIKLYIRKITEIQRPEMMELNMRDLYETYTRDIRFNTYINANDEYSDSNNFNVFLGHNHDDQFENIFTNIVSESHYNNLRGMETYTDIQYKQNIIRFVRPMLEIPKSDIYKFSSYFSIPHFKDSTPKWSQRGKIRDIVRPSIEQWNKRSIESFFKLSDTMTDLIKISEIYAIKITEKIKKDKQFELDLHHIYPKYLFKTIFEKLNIKISQKGLSSFYGKLIFIKENKKKYKINAIEKYRLNIDIVITWKNLQNDNIIIYF